MKKLIGWFLQSSLWMVGFGLMLASSGLDGTYMSKWMQPGWGALGYVLNTVSDISSMVVMYFYGRLQQSGKVKQRKSRILLLSELVTAGYSWFFCWLQLRVVLQPIEPVDFKWISMVAAGFIPAMLIFIGYTQSLLAGKFDSETESTGTKTVIQSVPIEQPVAITKPMAEPVVNPKPISLPQWREMARGLNGETPKTVDELNRLLSKNGFETKPTTTSLRWLKEVEHIHSTA